MRRDPLGFFLELARREPDVGHVKLGRRDLFSVVHPDLVHEVLIARNRDFISRDATAGLIRSGDPSVHLQGRRALQPAFGRAAVDACWPELVRLSGQAVERWPEDDVFDVLGELRKLTVETFATVVLGAELGIPADEALVHVRTCLDEIAASPARTGGLAGRLRLGRLLRLADAFETLLGALTAVLEERRREQTQGDDAAALLIRAQEGLGGLSGREVALEAFALLLGATETPATAVSWILYLLAQDARALAQVRAELAAVAPSATPPSPGELPYTHAVFREALRLYPPAWQITRLSVVEQTLGRHRVPRGAMVWIIPYVVQRDPRWYREPDRFLPERWLDGSAAGRPKLSFLPFGGGPYQCLGELLAWRELAAIVPAVLERRELVLPDGVTVTPEAASTLRPAGGLPMLLPSRVGGRTRTRDDFAAAVA